MHLTRTRLGDGREILYFDEQPGRERTAADDRDLPPVEVSSEIRYDALLDEWVVIAGHRQTRTFLPPADLCPLCPTRPGRRSEIPEPSYDVVVFENRFPSLAADLGRCEVVCFTAEHTSSFAALSPTRARLVIDAWAHRSAELATDPAIEQIYCFENRGAEIGVTLEHPHGQIYGYPFVTARTRRQLDSARAHRVRTRRNLYADLLAAERADGTRVVSAGRHWTAFVPPAARWPVEVHLYPHRQVPDLPSLTDDERDDLAVVYLDLLARLDRLYDTPLPYIAGWHQAPVRGDRSEAYLHLELFSVRRAADKLKYLAGSESGMGVFVSDVVPEAVAARLREVGR